MILGGSRYALPVIKAAHELGMYVITADYLPNNIAHKYSDEYCNVSIIDKEATLKEAQERNIDGVISFGCDPGVVTASYVADQMGLPSCGPYDSVCILQNKGRFRKFLADNGFNVPIAKGYTDIEEALKDIDMFHWPVIVKPTDSAGSKGVNRVDKKEDLRGVIEYALSYSHCNEFIIEDFLEQKGFSSDSDCFSVDGEIKFYSFNAQRFDKNAENPYTPSAYSWPTTFSKEHTEELKTELQRLITLLGLKTSVYNIETRECINGKVYIMEVSPRGGGNRLSEMARYGTGVDMITNAVRAAVGLPVENIEQKDFNGHWAIIMLHSTVSGTFDSLWISDDIKDNLIERDLWIESGTEVGGFKGANESIGTLILRFETEDEMLNIMNNQEKFVKVILK